MYDELIRILEKYELSEEFIIGVLGMGAATGLRISIEKDQPEMHEPFIDLMTECDLYIAEHCI